MPMGCPNGVLKGVALDDLSVELWDTAVALTTGADMEQLFAAG